MSVQDQIGHHPTGHHQTGHHQTGHHQTGHFHPLPVIGHPDAFYVKQIALADQAGNVHALESAKVGRYVTLAIDPSMPWEEKLRHCLHAMKRHCAAPSGARPEVEAFYHRLTEVVRRHLSQEAVRFVASETGSHRLRGQTGDPTVSHQQADELRRRLFGHAKDCPTWMTHEAWEQVNRLLARLG